MPSVDVRRQDKNQRKFSGERLIFDPLDVDQLPGEKAEIYQKRGQHSLTVRLSGIPLLQQKFTELF